MIINRSQNRKRVGAVWCRKRPVIVMDPAAVARLAVVRVKARGYAPTLPATLMSVILLVALPVYAEYEQPVVIWPLEPSPGP